MTPSRVVTLAVTVWLAGVHAGAAQPAAGPMPSWRPWRPVLTLGGGWAGAEALGAVTAETRATSIGTLTPPAFPLFRTESTMGGAWRADVGVTIPATPSLAIELTGTTARPTLATAIRSDAERGADVSATERVAEYSLGGRVVYDLPWAWRRRARPYVAAGGAYLRQLHEDNVLVETGRTWTAAAGARVWLRGARTARPLGVAGELGWTWRTGGIAFVDGTRSMPTLALRAFVGFEAMPGVALRAVGACRRFGAVVALDRVTLDVAHGECVALVGESGSGKSTLLGVFNGLTALDAGDAAVDGADVRTADVVALRRALGYVPQDGGLLPHWSVARNAALVPWLAGRLDHADLAAAALEMVGLPVETFGARWPHELSGGQRQRVAFARALAAGPRIVLLDEPFGALDAITRSDLQAMFLALRRRTGMAALLVTHDLHEAALLADRIAVIQAGRVEQIDTPDALVARPATPYVAALLARARLTGARA